MGAPRPFERAVNELRKNIRMNVAILRGLAIVQLLVIVVGCFLVTPRQPQVMSSPPWALYKTVTVLSFGVYLLWPLIIHRFQRRSRNQFKEKVRRGAVLIDAGD